MVHTWSRKERQINKFKTKFILIPGIPGHFIYMSLHKKATIVIYLVLQSTPTYVNAVAGYSIIAPRQATYTVLNALFLFKITCTWRVIGRHQAHVQTRIFGVSIRFCMPLQLRTRIKQSVILKDGLCLYQAKERFTSLRQSFDRR